MAGSLVKIAEQTVSSNTAVVTLTGIDTTYNVYKVVGNNVSPATDSQSIRFRVGTSGTPDSDSEYDMSFYVFESTGSYGAHAEVNQTSWRGVTYGNGTNEAGNFIMYLWNFADSSEYSFMTLEEVVYTNTPHLASFTGGAAHTVAEANDSISFHFASGDIANGTFKLYGLKK